MLIVEDGAVEVYETALTRYEKFFSREFPLYEHLNITRDGDYSISLAGAHRLVVFIDQRIAENKPVPIPDGYDERIY